MAGNGYKTKQSECILQYFEEHKDMHVTADDIIRFFRDQDVSVSKATVYRNLDKLLEQDMIRKYNIEDGMCSCYQYAGAVKECHEHYHFKCTKCGQLFHISCNFMNDIKSHVLEEHDFVIDSAKTVFYGLCGECRKAEK